MTDSLDIPGIKRLIWQLVGGSWEDGKPVKGSLQKILVAQTNIRWDHTKRDHSLYEYAKLLKEVQRMQPREIPYTPLPAGQHDWKSRYAEVHALNFKQQYPLAYKDGHYTPPTYPKVTTANGLTTFIINFILWNGYRATRINIAGRLVEAPEKQPSGVVLKTKKYMRSATRKGTADISATIKGKSYQFEIKTGRDRPRPEQLKEQQRERRAGGVYEFISTPEQFLTLWDGIMYGS